ncbi:hypothetical protein [Dactylosporangium sp. CS-033363]|uniref:hypothetical protein n=1 Tax=Dactylosporangium sp. CS-033363 TaxID=3239935 RepID=UPI003D919DF3
MSASREQRTSTAERRAKALKLRTAGVPLDEIATRLGYSSPAAVSKDLTRAMKYAVTEANGAAKERLAQELRRLDLLQAGHWPAALGGSTKSAAIVLGVIDRRIKLLQLDRIQADSANARSVLGELARGLALAASLLPETGDDANRPDLQDWDDGTGDDEDDDAGGTDGP